MTETQPAILLVEDSEDDVFLFRRALEKAKITIPLHVARDGQEALDYLAGDAKFSDRSLNPLPSLMFLDLKLPYVLGFEVLDWIRKQTLLANIPVVVLTSSPEDRDRKRAQELGAKAYLVKPPNREMLLEIIQLFVAQTENRRLAQ